MKFVQIFSFFGISINLNLSGETNFTLSLIYTLIVALAIDFGLFFAHWLEHKSTFLWQFHKVHHSAEVMNPITVFRMHPVDDMLALSFSSFFTALVDVLFRYFVPNGYNLISVFSLNLVIFIFYITLYNFRHSSVWISYGSYLEHYFISPAQHQVHHSKAKKHWDKNLGFIFAFWDKLFGTLYVTHGKEQLVFGLDESGEEKEFHNPIRMYYLPFIKAFKSLKIFN